MKKCETCGVESDDVIVYYVFDDGNEYLTVGFFERSPPSDINLDDKPPDASVKLGSVFALKSLADGALTIANAFFLPAHKFVKIDLQFASIPFPKVSTT